MRAFFSIPLVILGFAALGLGVSRIYNDLAQSFVAMLVILGGGTVALGGSTIANNERRESSTIGKWLFTACFLAFFALMVIGLVNIFSDNVVSLYLLAIGTIGAFRSAHSALGNRR